MLMLKGRTALVVLSLFTVSNARWSRAEEMAKAAGSAIGPATTGAVWPTLDGAIEENLKGRAPAKHIPTQHPKFSKFPSFSKCERSFFRTATISKDVDNTISDKGWMSGWQRKTESLKAAGLPVRDAEFDALPKTAQFEDRVIQYVRIKNKPSTFPKDSSVVGVLEDPIRTLSVGYHTGYDAGKSGKYMRMDEIEVGPCAQAEVCKKIKAYDTSAIFKSRNLTPRYSTEGEWAIEDAVPKECVVATYRIKFQKIDSVCYSDVNGNCGFK